MADTKTFRFILDSDGKAAIKGLDSFSAAAKKADTGVKELITKVDKLDSQTATIVLSVKAADVQSKLGDVLQQVTKLDANDPVIDVKLAQASSLKGDLDSIEAKVRSLNGTPIDIDTRAARTGLDDVGRSAGSSKSVLANMTGNAVQDLGVLGGVAGSAGVAIGQMGEYMADALGEGEKFSSVVGSFAKVAGPLAAVAVVTAVATSAWNNYKKTQAEAAKATDDAAKSIEEELGLVEKLKKLNLDKATTAAQEFNRSLIKDDTDRGKAIRALGDLNLVSDQLGTTMINLERNSRASLTTLAEGAGIPKEWAAAVAEAVDKTEKFSQARAVLAAKFDQPGADVANKYEKEVRALEQLNDQQQKSDTTKAAQEALDYARGIDTATASLVQQAEATAKSKNANADAVDVLDEYIKSATGASGATFDLGAAVASNSAGMLRAHDDALKNADALDKSAASSDKFAEALQRQQDALKSLSAAQAGSHDLALSSQKADLASADAIDKYNESLKDSKLSGREHQQAFIDVQSQISDTASTYADYVLGQVEGTGKVLTELDKVNLKHQAEITSLEKQRDTVAPNSELAKAIQGYIDQLNAIPTSIYTSIEVTAKAANELASQLTLGGVFGGLALGGPVRKGHIYEIGEDGAEVYESARGRALIGAHGPRLFIPPADGRIIPNDQIEQAVSFSRTADRGRRAARPSVVDSLAATYARADRETTKGYSSIAQRLATATGHIAGAITKQVPDFSPLPAASSLASSRANAPTPPPAPRSPGGWGGGTVVNIYPTINVDPTADRASVGRALAEALQAWQRTGGRVP